MPSQPTRAYAPRWITTPALVADIELTDSSTVLAPPDQPDWAERLAEIGFIPGESVAVLASAKTGDDPLVVRVGTSTFALRRAEAACVQVLPLEAGA